LGSTIVTAMSGIVLLDALRTVITRCVCWASRCDTGKVAVGISTVKLPFGSLTSCREPPPHPASAKIAATAAVIPQLLVLHPLNAP
jgi:hypothetical protein